MILWRSVYQRGSVHLYASDKLLRSRLCAVLRNNLLVKQYLEGDPENRDWESAFGSAEFNDTYRNAV